MGTHFRVTEDYSSRVRRVLVITLILNLAVSFAKILYGYLTDSTAMLSDGFHSLFDGASNVIGLIGIWIASHPPDERHPYGHRKFETLFTIAIGVMLFTTCLEILKRAYSSLRGDQPVTVTAVSFSIMLLTLAVNTGVMLYESAKGKELGSDYLIADARHTKSDIFVSLAVIVSLIFSKMGYHRADGIVALIVTIMIARIGYHILRDATTVLVDTVCLNTKAVESVVNNLEGVRGCHDIRTRGSQNAIYLDLHVLVDRHITTEESHAIADRIEDTIKKEFPAVVDIVVHMEPELEK